MTLTLTDLFCGGGGSSEGASSVPADLKRPNSALLEPWQPDGGSGSLFTPAVKVTMAANHWPLAVDVHNENHPDAEHDCADLSQVDPRRYPRTDMLWASPSCTKHSVAQGKARAEMVGDVDAERSRATMWDVQRFTEHHRYRFVFVENVVEVRKWPGFRGWKISMEDTGYCLHEVFLNAAFAGQLGAAAAQWRDRWFCLAHPKGTKCPDTARWTAPKAWCPCCETIGDTYQAWKPGRDAGKYRTQYLYRCTRCKAVTEPLTRPAAEIIDWSLPSQRIGDRIRPLAEKTMNRIRIGLDRYGPALVPVEGRDGKQPFPVDRPMRTCTARNETGLLVPAGGTWNDAPYLTSEPSRTVTTRETTGLVTAPFIAELRGGGSTARPVTDPLSTVCASGNHHGLVVPYYTKGNARTADEPLMTVTTVECAALVDSTAPSIDDCTFRMLSAREYAAAMSFPDTYLWRENSISKRHRVKLAGNAVPPNMARDLVACAVESI